jgi:hypothetical protein
MEKTMKNAIRFLLFSTFVMTACEPVPLRPADLESDSTLAPPPGFPEDVVVVGVAADASVWAGEHKDIAHGHEETIQVKNFEDSLEWGWAYRRGYLSFDLSELPQIEDEQVYLALFGNLKDGRDPVSVGIYESPDEYDDWDEDSLNWNNQPPRRIEQAVGEVFFEHMLENPDAYASEGAWALSSDLAPALRREQAGNGSLTLRLENETYNEILFFSREHPQAQESCARLVIVPSAP